jgi:hypothetical protein
MATVRIALDAKLKVFIELIIDEPSLSHGLIQLGR